MAGNHAAEKVGAGGAERVDAVVARGDVVADRLDAMGKDGQAGRGADDGRVHQPGHFAHVVAEHLQAGGRFCTEAGEEEHRHVAVYAAMGVQQAVAAQIRTEGERPQAIIGLGNLRAEMLRDETAELIILVKLVRGERVL